MYLVYERATGVVVGSIENPARTPVMLHHDTFKYEGVELPDFQTVKVESGVLVRSIPSEYLSSLKRQLSSKIDVARDAALAAGVTNQWGVFQADLQSSTNINGAVSMAMLNSDHFSILWRTADNKTVTLDAKGMIGVGVSVGQFVSAVYARSWTLKGTVEAATTPEAVKAIVINFSDITVPTMAANDPALLNVKVGSGTTTLTTTVKK